MLRTLLSIAGATNVTPTDVSGFVNVIGAVITLVAVIVAHITHKTAVNAQ